ncbi:MAG: hypothetical protein ACKO96_16940 [Flammeovirgaceae bacterium]
MSVETTTIRNNNQTPLDLKKLSYDDEDGNGISDLLDSYGDENKNGISDLLERIVEMELSRKSNDHGGNYSEIDGSVTARAIDETHGTNDGWSIADLEIPAVQGSKPPADITQYSAWLEVYDTVSKNIESIENPEMKDLLVEQLNAVAKIAAERLDYLDSKSK